MPPVDPNVVTGLAGAVNDNSAAYDLVLLAHVLTAVVAMVAIVVAGGFALALHQALRRGGDLSESLVRYYRPGINWVGRVLFAVPVFGIVLIALSGGQWGWSDTWISMGMGIWLVVAGVAEAVLWPAERRLQELVGAVAVAPGAEGTPGSGAGDRTPGTGAVEQCRTVMAASSGCLVALVAVALLMVAKP